MGGGGGTRKLNEIQSSSVSTKYHHIAVARAPWADASHQNNPHPACATYFFIINYRRHRKQSSFFFLVVVSWHLQGRSEGPSKTKEIQQYTHEQVEIVVDCCVMNGCGLSLEVSAA